MAVTAKMVMLIIQMIPELTMAVTAGVITLT